MTLQADEAFERDVAALQTTDANKAAIWRLWQRGNKAKAWELVEKFRTAGEEERT